MEARSFRPVWGLASVLLFLVSTASAQMTGRREHVAHSPNFIVFAANPTWATKVAEVAEQHRRELAIYWLGEELPAWGQRCPIHVQAAANLGAGGETRFSLIGNSVGNWMMNVQGTEERILDSVLPHEITHTIFATHFAPYNKYVPRWADEGACTTVEHPEEKQKHEYFLQEFLRNRRGIAFNRMFTLKDYPHDILPLYAQGHSVVQFLLDQGGARKFVTFLEEGMRTDRWEQAMKNHYVYENLGELQTLWNKWLADGSPEELLAYAPLLRKNENVPASLASAPMGSNVILANNTPASKPAGENQVQLAVGNNQPAPVQLASNFTGKPNSGYYSQRLREAGANTGSANDRQVQPLRTASVGDLERGERLVPGTEQQRFGSSQATARPLQPAGPQIQVLDWGNAPPTSGIQTGIQPIWR